MSKTSSGSRNPPTPTGDHPNAIVALDVGAEFPHGFRRAQHVLAFQEALDPVSPRATAPSIKARCDMDLSPGTVAIPASGLAFSEMQGIVDPHGFQLATL